MIDLTNTGGSFDRQDNSTHIVSMWHIPYGTEYSSAEASTIFFSDEGAAVAFARRWEMPPEMSMTLTIEEHDKIQRLMMKGGCAVCGHDKDGHIDWIDARLGQCDTWRDPSPQ